MEQQLSFYSHHTEFAREYARMTADGWTVQHVTQTSNASGGTSLWTVVWVKPTLTPEAIAYLAACPDPAIAAQATQIILTRAM